MDDASSIGVSCLQYATSRRAASLADGASLALVAGLGRHGGGDHSFLSERTLQREQQQINYGIRMQFLAGMPSVNRHNPPGAYSMTKPVAFMDAQAAEAHAPQRRGEKAVLGGGGARPLASSSAPSGKSEQTPKTEPKVSKRAAKKQEETDALEKFVDAWKFDSRETGTSKRLQLLMARKEAVDDEKTAIMKAWRKVFQAGCWCVAARRMEGKRSAHLCARASPLTKNTRARPRGGRFWFNDITGESTVEIPNAAIERAVTAKEVLKKRTNRPSHDQPEEVVSHGTGAKVYDGRAFEDLMSQLERRQSFG